MKKSTKNKVTDYLRSLIAKPKAATLLMQFKIIINRFTYETIIFIIFHIPRKISSKIYNLISENLGQILYLVLLNAFIIMRN